MQKNNIQLPEKVYNIFVTGIQTRAFANNSEIGSVFISNSIIRIDDYAFAGCESLSHICIPDSVNKIGNYVFEECKNVTVNCVESSYAANFLANMDNIKLMFDID